MEVFQDFKQVSTFSLKFTLEEYIALCGIGSAYDAAPAETIRDALETALDIQFHPPKKLPPTASLNT